MAGLKELKNRIDSVKSTQKITSAMKMVAASRLRKAQEAAESARPFADRMERMIGGMVAGLGSTEGAPALLAGTGKDDVHLLVAMTSDRGLCGGFNATIVRAVRQQIDQLQADGKTVKVLCVGRKARDLLRRDHGDKIVDTFEDIGRTVVTLEDAQNVTARIVEMFEAGEFDVCTITYNQFVSAMTQIVTPQQVIPVSVKADDGEEESGPESDAVPAAIEFEPDEEGILKVLLPKNLEVQILHGLLESNASEHGARMSAMDNATRNAGEMIDGLSLQFNRTRQAKITSELIEIISGAEAV